MDDYTIHVDSIAQVPSVGSDLRMVRVTRVTIRVGKHGPFSKDFAAGQDSPDAINAWKQQKMLEVQSIAG